MGFNLAFHHKEQFDFKKWHSESMAPGIIPKLFETTLYGSGWKAAFLVVCRDPTVEQRCGQGVKNTINSEEVVQDILILQIWLEHSCSKISY